MTDARRRKGLAARILRVIGALAALGAAPTVPATAAAPDTGPLRIGVPYLPPAYTTTDVRLYTEEGFEIDLAKALGKKLGAPVTLVRVADEQRAALLETGAIRLAIGRAAASDPLFAVATVRRVGFASGASVAMRADTTVRRWEDLMGRTVCLSEADTRARALAAAYGARLRVERAPARSLMLVRTGDCDAAIHDEALLAPLFEREEWRKFSATLPSALPTELVLAHVKDDGALAARLDPVLAELTTDDAWTTRRQRWAANVAFEVHLDQEAPDCH